MTFSPAHRVLVLVLSFLCASAGLAFLPPLIHGAAADAGSYATVSTANFSPASTKTCRDPGRASPEPGGASAVLRLTHRHGPCAPEGTAAKEPTSFAELLRADQRRAEYVQRRVSQQQLGGSKAATVPTTMGYSIGTLQYVVTVSLGTPAVAQTVEVDTGSDVSWVQCKPCPTAACYGQRDPLFDPAQSSSYLAVPCGAAACSALGIYSSGCSGAQCGYVVSYGDGSNTTGVYGSDKLTLTGSSDVVNGFRFGCGRVQSGSFAGVDGLVGLGRQAASLMSQTSATYGGVFSYCLPPTQSTTGYLTLGGPSSSSGFSTTALLSSPSAPTFYLVMLAGVSVGGQQLGVPASVFSGGTVVDSGTVITRLPPAAYAALRSAFRAAIARYGYPAAPAIGILDTCYDFTGYGTVTLPTVALTFSGGATMTLEASGILSSGCLAFAPSGGDGDPSILGNVQQRSFAVRFDSSTVGFKPRSC